MMQLMRSSQTAIDVPCLLHVLMRQMLLRAGVGFTQAEPRDDAADAQLPYRNRTATPIAVCVMQQQTPC